MPQTLMDIAQKRTRVAQRMENRVYCVAERGEARAYCLVGIALLSAMLGTPQPVTSRVFVWYALRNNKSPPPSRYRSSYCTKEVAWYTSLRNYS